MNTHLDIRITQDELQPPIGPYRSQQEERPVLQRVVVNIQDAELSRAGVAKLLRALADDIDVAAPVSTEVPW